MGQPRKHPRLNVRFLNLEVMDEIELFANTDGLDLQNWIRKLIFDEMNGRPLERLILRSQFESILIIRGLLEHLVDDDVIQATKIRAQHHIERLEKHAAKK